MQKLLCNILFLLYIAKLGALNQGPGPVKITYSPTSVTKGETVTLTCNLDSDKSKEHISFHWYRGFLRLPVNESVFTIDPVTLETRNNFSCVAVNKDAEESEMDTVFLDVKAPPYLLRSPPRFVGVMYTSANLHLTCIVECFPLCSISWFKDGKLLKDDSTLYIIETKYVPASFVYNDFEAVYSKLSWHMTGKANKMNKYDVIGNYTCLSTSNTAGEGVGTSTEVFVRGEQAA